MIELCRYIVLNPVRARMVETVADWPWSSYQATAGMGMAPAWRNVDGLLRQFGPSREVSQVRYRQFVAEGVDNSLTVAAVARADVARRCGFLACMDAMVQDPAWADVLSAQTQPLRPTPEEVLQQVGAIYGVAREDLLNRMHQPAFQAAIA